MVPVSGGYYAIVKTETACNEILIDFEKWLGEHDGWWEVDIDRVALGQSLRMTFKYPEVCPRDFTKGDFRMRTSAARGALLLKGGVWIQFDSKGNATVSKSSLDKAPYPLFFKDVVNNADVDIDALERHISGIQRVNYSRLQGHIEEILGVDQADCYMHVIARVLANQPDAFKKVLFLYGTGRELGKSLLAHIMKTELGLSDGIWKLVGPDIKKVFTTETQDSQSILKAMKEYTSQAVVVLEEVGAAGNQVYNQNNKPVVFNALKTKQDGTAGVYMLKKKTVYSVTNRCCFILTGNTESAMDAFTGMSPGDATRVYPIHCGDSNVGYKEGDADYDRRYEAAKKLYEDCTTDRKNLLLEFLALIVDYAKRPLKDHMLSWPALPTPSCAQLPQQPVFTWCDNNPQYFTKGDQKGIARTEVWQLMRLCGADVLPDEASGGACVVHADAADDWMKARFGVTKPDQRRSSAWWYPGVNFDSGLVRLVKRKDGTRGVELVHPAAAGQDGDDTAMSDDE